MDFSEYGIHLWVQLFNLVTEIYTMRHKFSNFHLVFKMQMGMKMK